MVLKSILLKRDSESNWETNNPILGIGEPGLVYPTNDVRNPFKLKIGNGQDKWSDLPYFAEGCEYIVDLGKFSNSGAGEAAAAQPDVYSNPKAVFIIYGLTGSDSRAIIEQSISASGTSYTTSQFLQLNGIKYCRKITYTKSSSGTISNSSVGSWKKVGDSDGIIFSRGSEVVNTSTEQTISGSKTFSSQIITKDIIVNNESVISSDIDPGELKVFHHDPNNAEGKQNKGFILRSKINESEEIPSVELLGTNGDASYQYNFPKTNGNVALGAKINGKVHSASLEDGLISFEIGDHISATDITHGELLELKNNKQLKPGQPYRIIDYITTTNGRENSSSANHKFDLIVEALTTDQLSENAKACHAKYLNEEYSYDITNPLCGHTIAVANWGGVGINDIPDGIKNLPFTAEDGDDVRSVTIASYKQSAITCNEGSIKVIWQWQNGEGHTKKINILGVELIDASDNRIVSSDYHIGSTGTTNNSNLYTVAAPKTGTYKFKYYIDGKTEEVNSSCTVYAYPVRDYFENCNLSAWEIGYNIENNVDRYRWAQTNGTGKGVIYYMKDEFCNEATYDFKNIKYNDKYTFSYTINNVLYDGSIKYGSYCHHNVVGPDMIVGGTQFKGLSKIYFLNTAANAECNNNIIYNNCWDIQFGSGCYGNKIGVGCEQIYLGDNCSLNTFGDGTQKITLGSNSIQNHFGEKCYNCKISSDSSGNSALTHVKNVSFGNECNGVILWTSNTNTSDYLQNYKLGNSLTGSIEISGENTRGRSYTTEINFNTSGEIKQFYLSEITQVKEDLNILNGVVSGKQGNIDDLDEIRSGAELGKTALQAEDLPTTLPNPNSLIVQKSGTTIATYDGSSETTVNISFTDSAADINYVSEYAFGKDKTKRTIPAGTDLNTLDYGAWTSLDNTEYTNGDDSTNFGILVTRVGQAYKAQLMLGYRSSKLKFRSQYYIPETEGTPASIGWSNWEDVVFKSSLDDEVSGIVSGWATENEVIYKNDLDSAIEDIINNSIPEAIENAITKTLNTEI